MLTLRRAYARIGTAYEKQGDLGNAINFYQKAQTEHRTPEVLAKLRAAEKAKIKQEKDAYINPEEAERARELGNAKFKEADWPAAVEAYTEMIKRAPEDPRGYSNRAACYIKLLAFPSAIEDCDQAIKLDPKFIRAYLRKAQAYFVMKEYNKCINVCAEAMEHDDGKNAREIQQQETKALQAQYSAREGETEQQTMERIQRDPEVCSAQSFVQRNSTNTVIRLSAFFRIQSCRAFCSKRRTTLPRYRSISRIPAFDQRFKSLFMPVLSVWDDELGKQATC